MARRLNIRATVRRRAGGRCEICGQEFVIKKGSRQASLHHRLMRRDGGVDGISNLVHLCLTCHRHIHRHPAWDAEREAGAYGWVLWTLPEVTPLYLHGERWVLLGETGEYEDIATEDALEMIDYLLRWAPSVKLLDRVA